ncbi:hypothetical protein ILUMI_17211 [Ignelater luminosus]|uniref:Mos1 transposase HTH domain-containing protein n=1 Tax=Ignelater luminosus TaxID=2038154 RepID=A0A8K0CPH5_IGNLU|nr:hypothetical protein ILUMI_17211 [Ignelater luminosus]
MPLTQNWLRTMLYYDFTAGLSDKESVERLRLTFGDKAPSSVTVFRWFREFERGCFTLEDAERPEQDKSNQCEKDTEGRRTFKRWPSNRELDDNARTKQPRKLQKQNGGLYLPRRNLLREGEGRRLCPSASEWTPPTNLPRLLLRLP